MLNKKVLILSALEGVERQLLRPFLSGDKTEYHPISGTDYYTGLLATNAGDVEVILARTDQTNVSASLETERALNHFQPRYVFFVGIAGGLKDVGIGDIVIGKDVFGYERGKDTGEGFKSRPSPGLSSYMLERMATNYAHSEGWKAVAAMLPNSTYFNPIEVYTGTVASGEKVDASTGSELHKFLQVHCNHALAIEMEGYGFLEAARQHPSTDALLIRGISDLVDNKAASDAGGSQPYATENAATFTINLIKHLYSSIIKSRFPTDAERKQFVSIATELYPSGVREDSIWERAGGKVSAVPLSTNGKSQWLEGIRLISNGGGGDITFNSLLDTMLEDYESNEILIKLRGN